MYDFHLIADWIGLHIAWGWFGLAIVAGTLVITWYFDKRHTR